MAIEEAEVRARLERLERSPADDKALEDVWGALASRERWADLARVAEQAARKRRDPRAAAALHLRVAELVRTYLKDEARALDAFDRAAKLDPSLAKAHAASRRIYVKQRRYARATAALLGEIAGTPDASERAAAYREVSDAHGDADLGSKIAMLERVVTTHPKDVAAARALAALYVRRADAPHGTARDRKQAASILARLAAAAAGDARRELAEGALDAWAGEEAALVILEQLLARDPSALEARRRAYIEAAGPSETAQRMRRDLADRMRAEGKLDEACELLAPLVEIDPYVTRALEELYRESGRLGALDQLLAKAKLEDPIDKVAALRQRAEIARTRGDQAQAIARLRELLLLDPTDGAALGEVEQALRAQGAWADLRETFAAAARVREAHPLAKKRWWREVATLDEERLGDDGAAVDATASLLEVDPNDAAAQGTMERLLEKTRRWGELAERLEARANGDKALLLRAVEIRRDRQNDVGGALALLDKLAEAHPDDEAIASARLDARSWADGGDDEPLGETLRARAKEEQPAPRAAERWLQLARWLSRRAASKDEALEAWRRARELDPTRGEAWSAEESLLEEKGDRAALLDTLLAHAASVVAATEGSRLPLLVRAVKLAIAMGDAEKATAAAEQASAWKNESDELSKLLLQAYALGEGGAPASEKKDVAPPPMGEIIPELAGPAEPPMVVAPSIVTDDNK